MTDMIMAFNSDFQPTTLLSLWCKFIFQHLWVIYCFILYCCGRWDMYHTAEYLLCIIIKYISMRSEIPDRFSLWSYQTIALEYLVVLSWSRPTNSIGYITSFVFTTQNCKSKQPALRSVYRASNILNLLR